MRFLGADDDAAAGRLARRCERGDRRDRGSVLDVAVPPVGQPEQLRQPVDGVRLELGQRRRRAPDEADRVERRRDQLGEDPGLRRAVGEVREEARALPVGRRGNDDLVEVSQHVCEGLPVLGRRRRQAFADVTRLHLCQHGKLADLLEIPRAHSSAAAPSSRKLTCAASRSAATCACSAPGPSSARRGAPAQRPSPCAAAR